MNPNLYNYAITPSMIVFEMYNGQMALCHQSAVDLDLLPTILNRFFQVTAVDLNLYFLMTFYKNQNKQSLHNPGSCQITRYLFLAI